MTKIVRIGDRVIGGGNTPLIQTMTNVRGIDNIVAQINSCAAQGADIVRVAVNNAQDAADLATIKQQVSVPIVADIQYDWRLAVLATNNGADKIRINPGNMASDKLSEVVKAAKERGIPIRVGVNGGSLDKNILAKFGGACAEALAESALDSARLIEEHGYDNIVLAVKSSDVRQTVEANRLLSAKSSYPLHIGITEAGTPDMGLAKSYSGLGALLLGGVGDTLRISLTASPESEVTAAKRLLAALKIIRVPEIISCPTCARCTTDIEGMATELEKFVANIKKPLKIAVMGCVVNGPGEARDADVGLAGGGDGRTVIFERGQVVSTVPASDALPLIKSIIERLAKQ